MKKRKYYFTYSNTEHKSYVVVSILVLLYVLTKVILNEISSKEYKPDQKTIIALQNIQQPSSNHSIELTQPYDFTHEFSTEPTKEKSYGGFAFDPNQADSLTLLKLGFSPKQARMICNYRRKGGFYKTKKDLKKMYGVNDYLYQQIEQYIQIDTSIFNKKREHTSNVFYKKTEGERRKYMLIELNDADTVGLKFMKGIGSKLARRIIQYRERLGGFFRKKQLLEVYGIDTTTYRSIEPYLLIDTTTVRKININKVYFENIKSFPYLTRNQAVALVNYRNRHGDFKSLDDLKKCVLIDDSTLQKIRPYFVLNE